MQGHLAVGGDVVGNERRQANAQVDHRALGDVGGNAGCELVLRPASRCKCHALKPPAAVTVRGTGTTRCTKMPGVTMDSGSSAPSGTTRSEAHTSELQSLMRTS